MKYFIHLTIITLLLALPLSHQPQPLSLEEGHDSHLFEKAEKKLPLVPFFWTYPIIIILFVIDSPVLLSLHVLTDYRKRFFNPIFYQGNYVSTLTH